MSTFPNGRAAINAYYGNPDGGGKVDPKWQAENLIVVTLPYPMVTSWDGKTVTKVQFHRKAAASLLDVLSAILSRVKSDLRLDCKEEIPVDEMRRRMAHKYGHAVGTKENDRLTTGSYDDMVEARTPARLRSLGLDILGGTFNFRAIRGASSLSMHSYGIAIDLDPERNALGSAKYSMPQFAVDIFEAHGWTWGGRWKRKDAQHFQAASGA